MSGVNTNYNTEAISAAATLFHVTAAQGEELAEKIASQANILIDENGDIWEGNALDELKDSLRVVVTAVTSVKKQLQAMSAVSEKVAQITGSHLTSSKTSFAEARDALQVARGKLKQVK